MSQTARYVRTRSAQGAAMIATAIAFVVTALWTPVARAADAEIERVTSLLQGSWISSVEVEAIGDAASERVVMHVQPVTLPGIPNAMYVEQARDSEWHAPYRQAIFQLYRFGGPRGEIRLRTYEFKNTPGIRPTLVGLWLVPDIFPELAREGLHATLDVVLREDGDGYAGATPYPYPTGALGAVQMTSEMTLSDGRLTTRDTGFGMGGTPVWGGDEIAFERVDVAIGVERSADGLVMIDFTRPDGPVADSGSNVTVHYTGWTRDLSSPVFGGSKFDSSYDRPNGPEPFTFDLPGRLIEGWNQGIPGVTKGTIRRLIIPSAMAYGERGAAGGRIAPNADLFFEIEVVDIANARGAMEDETNAAEGEGEGN
ncbi:MAG: CpcT/CpeT family chromophore lyase [Planctomycetota bacterium]